MATEVKVPTLGESVTEATVGELLKNVGDAVAVDVEYALPFLIVGEKPFVRNEVAVFGHLGQ